MAEKGVILGPQAGRQLMDMMGREYRTYRNEPPPPPRQPVLRGDDAKGIRYGKLLADISANQIDPGVAVAEDVYADKGPSPADGCTKSAGPGFYTINDLWGMGFKKGTNVACAPASPGVMHIIQADCPPGTTPPPPPDPCPDPPIPCPPGQTPTCVNGAWVCVEDSPPPDPCLDPPPTCPAGQIATCSDGTWVCVEDDTIPCTGPPPVCQAGYEPWCKPTGVWTCVQSGQQQPPPPPPDESLPDPCSGPPPVCPQGYTPSCNAAGEWECKEDLPPCSSQPPVCPPGYSPWCNTEGNWVCLQDGTGTGGTGSGGGMSGGMGAGV